MAIIKCPECGGDKNTPLGGNQYQCQFCGATFIDGNAPAPQPAPQPVPQPMHQAPHPQQFAQYAAQQQQPGYRPSGKSKLVAGLLGIFLGGLGIHKFYLGKIGMGILYLIFCWTYIPALVGFIEGIIYLCASDQEFEYKYTKK